MLLREIEASDTLSKIAARTVEVCELTVTKEGSQMRSGNARAGGIIRNAKYSFAIATGSNITNIAKS